MHKAEISSIEVGQLSFTFAFPENDEAQETQMSVSLPADAVSTPRTVCLNTRSSEQDKVSMTGVKPGKRKWNSLIDKVYAPRNLQSACEKV